MKKLVYLFSAVLLFSSCSTTKDASYAMAKDRHKKKLANQETVKNAVESQRFIVKLDRMYLANSGIVQLVPGENYLIVYGEKGAINTAYLGRQYGFRPISAINMFGRTTDYKLTKYADKGTFGVSMKICDDGTSFTVFLKISKSGICHVSISSMLTDNVRFSGSVAPITSKSKAVGQKKIIS
jgi:hypothetical protein